VTGAEQRACPACGAGFTWTPAAPRQRFCSAPCRHRWWDRRRRQATAFLNRDSTPLPGSEPAPAPGAHDPRGETPRGDGPRGDGPRDSGGTLAAVPACPHCRKPVAVVAWLVPPAAASVATPQRHADNNA
jgi:endogenous inhibitor of DNA gyrase (YacG/DUF329 family)